MKLADFNRLKKTLERTFSENDHEALASLRAANRILQADSLTWERVLNRSINVIAEFEAAHDDPSEIDDLFEEAARRAWRETELFVMSVHEYYREKGFITDNQRMALKRIRDR